MSAIRPNLNFYNERQEHVPYQDSVAEKARATRRRKGIKETVSTSRSSCIR
jgi:hypothetical protein